MPTTRLPQSAQSRQETFPVVDAQPILLRPLRTQDAATLTAWLADPRLAAAMNLAPQRHSTDDVARYILAFDERSNLGRAVSTDANGRMIGLVTSTIDLRHKLALYNLMIAADGFRREAVVVAATCAAFDWLFYEKGAGKVATRTSPRRPRLGRLMETLGMTREGLLRGEVLAPDGVTRLDQVAHGLLASDWPVVRARTQDWLRSSGY